MLSKMAFAFPLAFSLTLAESTKACSERSHSGPGKYYHADTRPNLAMLNHTLRPFTLEVLLTIFTSYCLYNIGSLVFIQ